MKRSAPSPLLDQLLELTVTDMLADGQGVGRTPEGQVVFVHGALPDERVRVRITGAKARHLVAELIEILEPSRDRITPRCPVFGRCGGCQTQHMDYHAQLAWKHRVVVEALRRIGSLRAVSVAPTIGADDPWAYRNKMALVARAQSERIDLGFYRARSHELVPIHTCAVLLPQLQADLTALRAVAEEPSTVQAAAHVRHVVVRRTQAGDQGVLALTTLQREPDLEPLAHEIQRRLAGTVGVSNSYAPSGENTILGRYREMLAGEEVIEERIAGVRYRLSVQSFFQVHAAMLERVLLTLRPRLMHRPRILDLYCGVGTFAVFFATLGCPVVGFEENAGAIEEAQANAALNGVAERTRFAVGAVERLVLQPLGKRILSEAEAIFLDPPRKGSDEVTLTAIAASTAREVYYLSCNPATLARDAAQLVAAGFRVAEVQPFDMFPQTGHIEVLLTLTRGDAAS